MLVQRTRIGLEDANAANRIGGIGNLLSAVTPSEPLRSQWFKEIFPFYIRAGGHLFSAIAGFILLTLAANSSSRK